MIIINPGSENKGGTLEQARKNAQDWLDDIKKSKFPDVKMKYDKIDEYGNFTFIFTHQITNKTARLGIHGFTKEECKAFRFHPRVYWNGCSSSNPEIEDWLPKGWNYKIVYYEKLKKKVG